MWMGWMSLPTTHTLIIYTLYSMHFVSSCTRRAMRRSIVCKIDRRRGGVVAPRRNQGGQTNLCTTHATQTTHTSTVANKTTAKHLCRIVVTPPLTRTHNAQNDGAAAAKTRRPQETQLSVIISRFTLCCCCAVCVFVIRRRMAISLRDVQQLY